MKTVNNKKIDFVTNFALEQINKYNLNSWKIKFDYAKRRAGLCDFRKKVISLSKYYISYADKEHIKDTILHEIAHALVGPRQGHNKIWKKTALSLGCSGTRCHQLNFIKAKWIISCKNNCFSQERHRRKNGLICRTCKSPVIYKKNN